MPASKVEFVRFQSANQTAIPIPGMTAELWNGLDEPKLKATLISVHREPYRGDDNRYRCHFVTTDARMVALDERCHHEVDPDRGYCIRCNIVPHPVGEQFT